MKKLNLITGTIIEKAIEVHRALGPGLLESAYQACLAYELSQSGLDIVVQKPLPLVYKEVRLECGFRVDIFVANEIIVEIKSVEGLAPIHLAQMLTYLRLQEKRLGLLMNFNVEKMKDGIKRVIDGY